MFSSVTALGLAAEQQFYSAATDLAIHFKSVFGTSDEPVTWDQLEAASNGAGDRLVREAFWLLWDRDEVEYVLPGRRVKFL